MTRSVLWDSSAILALLDADDADHARAVAVARHIASDAHPSFIREILARQTDKDWTLYDLMSFAVLEARRVGRAFTFDHHFRQYGPIHVLGLKT